MRKGGTAEPTTSSTGSTEPPRADLRAFKSELTPAWLSLIALLGGHRPPAPATPFRAAYLGGGRGFTAAVAAAVHPEAEVWWWDPDVRAVEAARHLRDRAGLTNLAVHERPELPADLGGPPVDVLVVDGVMDASPEIGWHGLGEALATSLRPGGLVCVSYRTEVGWREVVPVHRLIRHLVGRDPRPPLEAAAEAKRSLVQLRDGGAGYLTDRPVVAAWLEQVLALPLPDLLEQVADRDLCPVSHARVRDVLEGVGCTYVGPALLSDLAGSPMNPDLAAVVGAAPSEAAREALSDLAVRRTHRADLFRLGSAPLSTAERHKSIDRLTITRTVDIDTADPALRSVARVATLRALADRDLEVAEIPGTPAAREATLRGLLATGTVHPIHPTTAVPGDRAAEAAARLTALTSKPPVPVTQRILASPVLAGAVPLSNEISRERRRELGIP